MLLTEKYSDQIAGVLHCYDRIVIQGTIPGICYAGGMTSYLYLKKIRIFDYPKFAEPFKNEIRDNAEKIARSNDLPIQFLKNDTFGKKPSLKRYWVNGATIQDWFTFSQRWKHVPHTSPGIIKKREKRISNRFKASAYTIIST